MPAGYVYLFFYHNTIIQLYTDKRFDFNQPIATVDEDTTGNNSLEYALLRHWFRGVYTIKTMEQIHHGKSKGEGFYSLCKNLGGREDKFIVAFISSANLSFFILELANIKMFNL